MMRLLKRAASLALVPRLILVSVSLAAMLMVAALFFDIGLPSAIVITAITLVVGFTTQVILSDRQHQRTIETRIRERNADVYLGFLKFWLDLLLLPENQKRREDGGMTRDFLVPKMNEVSQPLMLWSSNEFACAYSDFRRMLTSAERTRQALPPLETLFALEDLIVIMRKDMGHDVRGIKRGDLLSFFVNDLEGIDSQIGVRWVFGQKPTPVAEELGIQQNV